eukprot:178411-Rhodomonas_salina.5
MQHRPFSRCSPRSLRAAVSPALHGLGVLRGERRVGCEHYVLWQCTRSTKSVSHFAHGEVSHFAHGIPTQYHTLHTANHASVIHCA